MHELARRLRNDSHDANERPIVQVGRSKTVLALFRPISARNEGLRPLCLFQRAMFCQLAQPLDFPFSEDITAEEDVCMHVSMRMRDVCNVM